jgi:hypothetical protein
MEGFTDLTNRFSHGGIGGKQLQALKDHVKEYFIVGQGTQGLVNLRLDIVGDESLSADCDITDHYVESNTAYQDQISLKPKIYTINGEVGELVWYQKDNASQIFGQVAQRLEGIVSFLPIRSKSFNQMKSEVMKAAQWVDTASNAVSKISNLMSDSFGSVTHQQQAYQELVAIRDGRKPVSVKTPWGILEDYAITNLKLTQPKETKDKSTISITFKQFRTTSVGKVEFDASKYQGNAVYENEPKVDNGKTYGEDKSISEKASEIEDMSDDISNNINPDDDVWVQENEDFACSYSYEKDALSFYKKENGKWTTEIGDDVFESRVLESCQEKILSQIGS